jgi:hypothetical protein
MKKIVVTLAIITAALPAMAAISSGFSNGALIVVAAPEPRTVAVSLTMPADYVSVPLRIYSDQKNAALAYEESRQAVELISQKVKADGRFQVSMGVAKLSRRESSFGISSGSWNQPAASTDVFLLAPLTKERNDIFQAGAEAAKFVETLQLPGKAHCELGQLQLAVENPEQYRTKLLGLIAEEIRQTRKALATQGSVKVEGLEGPVMVRQSDDRRVELFLNYSLSVVMDK